jgi:hypothetical protein
VVINIGTRTVVVCQPVAVHVLPVPVTRRPAMTNCQYFKTTDGRAGRMKDAMTMHPLNDASMTDGVTIRYSQVYNSYSQKLGCPTGPPR